MIRKFGFRKANSLKEIKNRARNLGIERRPGDTQRKKFTHQWRGISQACLAVQYAEHLFSIPCFLLTQPFEPGKRVFNILNNYSILGTCTLSNRNIVLPSPEAGLC
jgi:hypothetical protein